jgi:hypothetical protein
MKVINQFEEKTTSKSFTIQYGNDWFNDYLVYTEWYKENGKVIDYKLVDQDGNIITDEELIEAVQEQVDNMIED